MSATVKAGSRCRNLPAMETPWRPTTYPTTYHVVGTPWRPTMSSGLHGDLPCRDVAGNLEPILGRPECPMHEPILGHPWCMAHAEHQSSISEQQRPPKRATAATKAANLIGRRACMATYKDAGRAWRPIRTPGVHGDLCCHCRIYPIRAINLPSASSRLHFSVHEDRFKSPPRKGQFNFDNNAYFHGPPSSSSPQFAGNEDDKRIVHTGPNPLHN
ncbi:hypothetical protein F3Y22_tig00110597pilonHSYRG01268 [Hibiscus syriacus]|uniref:Uncharacterized protein n=1 Tax=Hibiscus syriacus TaxID=106335 RepID=A0A6A3A4N1_HIBSY|nr:hypothetical protein F3Y22_tig00110597pilonHSYRG01268 [Hibiscus syriacus]